MNNNILKIVVGLILVYLIYKNYSNCEKIEKMADTTNIREVINSIYKADIQSIRNLEAISTKLQEGGLTVPGDLTVDGKFNYLPRGSIIAYNGKTAPKGWALCNGQNGTPDLRGRFIYGYGARQGSQFRKTGGEEKHKLNVNELPSHNHSMNSSGKHNHDTIDGNVWQNRRYGRGDGAFSGGGGAAIGTAHNNSQIFRTTNNGSHVHSINNTGSNQSHNNMPPFYVLSYIMKL